MLGTARRKTAPGLRFLDPKVLARIDNLEIVARTVVEGFISGLHRSPFLGLSIDFAEHRAYMPGDDIRRIDWRLFGRTDRFYVKEFEADTNANLAVVLDVSKSMAYGSHGVTKLQYASFLAASLAYMSHRQRDRVGMVSFDSDIIEYVPPSAKHFEVVLHTLDRAQATRAGSLAATLPKIAESFRRRSVVAVISDFYDDPPAVLEAVNSLRQKGNDLIAFHVLDPMELRFDFDDPANIEDLETGELTPVVPEMLREQYRALIQEHIATIGRTFGEHRIDYELLDTSQPLDDALFRYLSNRERLTRVR